MSKLVPMHGRDHRPVGFYGSSDPGGPDPITPMPGFTRRAVSLTTAYFAPGNLEAWWRLGEAGPFPTSSASVGSFCADSSPHHRNLTAENMMPDGTTVFASSGDTRLPTMHAAGALTFGDPSINDGAILFHWNSFTQFPGSPNVGPLLRLLAPGGDNSFGEQSFAGGALAPGQGFSVATWMRFETIGSSPGADVFTPFASDGHDIGFRPIAGCWKDVFGGSTTGWKLGWDPYTGQVKYLSSNALGGYTYSSTVNPAAGEWFLFVMALACTGTNAYRRTFYLNSAVDTVVTGNATTLGVSGGGMGLTLGGSMDDDARFGNSRGGLDEFSIFSKELSADEVANLYAVQVASGDTWTTDKVMFNDFDTTGASDGMVPVFSTTGNVIGWQYPIVTYHNGA